MPYGWGSPTFRVIERRDVKSNDRTLVLPPVFVYFGKDGYKEILYDPLGGR